MHRSVSSMYQEIDREASDKRSTKRVSLVIGDDVDVAIDGFPVERGRAPFDIMDRSEYSAGNGTTGRPSSEEKWSYYWLIKFARYIETESRGY